MATRGQKHFRKKGTNSVVTNEEIYLMVMLFNHQNKSLEALARQFNISRSDAKEIIIRSRFGGACG